MTGFDVAAPELRRAATGWDQRADHLSQLKQQVQAAQLSRDAFGYIPGIGARIYQEYSDLLEEAMLCLDSAGRGLGNVGDGLRAVAAEYEGTDSAQQKEFSALSDWVVEQDGWGAR